MMTIRSRRAGGWADGRMGSCSLTIRPSAGRRIAHASRNRIIAVQRGS